MTKPLLACLFVGCLISCTFTTQNTGHLFVNQDFLVTEIRSVQPATEIAMTVETTNGRDSVLIVKLEVDPKIPDDSLKEYRARQVLSSFIMSLPEPNTFASCRIVFSKTTGSVVSTGRSISYIYPITPRVRTDLQNYKDSTKLSVGYMDTNWTYINKDLHLTLPLKKDWFYVSEEHDSLVYYTIGSDISLLPQYRTDTDRKVSFKTLYDLDPGQAHVLLGISKYDAHLIKSGPAIFVSLDMNRFSSEDEYLKTLNEILFSRKLPEKEIYSYHFGNANFRGVRISHELRDGNTIQRISAIRQFRRVSLVLNMSFSNDQEFAEIKQVLSNLMIE